MKYMVPVDGKSTAGLGVTNGERTISEKHVRESLPLSRPHQAARMVKRPPKRHRDDNQVGSDCECP